MLAIGDRFAHDVERLRELADFVVRTDLDPRREIAASVKGLDGKPIIAGEAPKDPAFRSPGGGSVIWESTS